MNQRIACPNTSLRITMNQSMHCLPEYIASDYDDESNVLLARKSIASDYDDESGRIACPNISLQIMMNRRIACPNISLQFSLPRSRVFASLELCSIQIPFCFFTNYSSLH
jgi:hypothetical protein